MGIDNLPDILEILTSDLSSSYYVPQTISYDIYSSLEPDLGPQNEVDSSKNIIFDIESINFDDSNSLTTVMVNITASIDFKALEFRFNHSPYIDEIFTTVNSKDLIHRVNQDELFEDISIHENLYLDSEIFSSLMSFVFLLKSLIICFVSANFSALISIVFSLKNLIISF